MPLNNLFALTVSYKRITHTKKVGIGDWVLVKKQGRGPVTIVQGVVEEYTKTGRLDLSIMPKDVQLLDPETGHLQPKKTMLQGTLSIHLSDESVQAWLWIGKQVDATAARPCNLNRDVCFHVMMSEFY